MLSFNRSTAFICILLAVFAFIPANAGAADDIIKKPVHFPAGATGTTIKDQIVGRQSISFVVGAEAGQVMTIRLASDNDATYFNVYVPGRGPGDEALANSSLTGPTVPDLNHFKATLPTSGQYIVSVYLYRAAARRNETSRFTLDIAISARGDVSELPPVDNDFADGLAGGPDFWEVTNVSGGDVLNMRRAPSAKEIIVASYQNGAVLRNKGCRMMEGQRWCKVEEAEDASVHGWVAGRYLRESNYAGQSGASGTDDAKVPGTDFNATGNLPCAREEGQPMSSCAFGVVREGDGSGYVQISWPDGGSRAVFFRDGQPSGYDESQADAGAKMSVKQNADLFIIAIGPQRFEIPDVVFAGD
jgi:hypothetical protein